MTKPQLEICELAAWGFDRGVDRGPISATDLQNAALKGRRSLADREAYALESPIVMEQARCANGLFVARTESVAASGEFDGLDWELAMVDLGKLIAFQRRIGFSVGENNLALGRTATFDELLEFAVPSTPPSLRVLICAGRDGSGLTIRTLSPNLRLRFNTAPDHGPYSDLAHVRLLVHSGSPYMEVASYGGRWFLRDGYHRAFRLLRRGIRHVPAVVMHAKTLAQLGAMKARFFAEDVLFSARPPLVTDFLEDDLTLRYLRIDRERIFHVLIEEQPAPVFTGGCEEETP